MPRLSRRSFLRASGSALAAGVTLSLGCKKTEPEHQNQRPKSVTLSVTPSLTPGPEARKPLDIRGTVIGPGKYMQRGKTHYVLSLIDLDRGTPKPRFIPLSFHGHGVSPHPLDPGRAVIFQKQGPGSCEVDLRAGTVTRTIETAKQRWFYGHGAWTHDGQLLFATETNLATGAGIIVIRDGKSFDILGEFSTHGAKPHDCVLIDSGRVLAITNGGGKRGGVPPSVTYVELDNQKLLEKIELSVDYLNTGHLALTPRGDLVVVSAQREGMPDDAIGGVSLRPAGGTLTTMTSPKEVTQTLRSESLSVSIHVPTGLVGVTNPKANLVTFWNLPEQRFVGKLDLPHPRGIGQTLDQNRFLVSYGKAASLIGLTTDSFELIDGSRVANAGLAGSHFITHQFPA